MSNTSGYDRGLNAIGGTAEGRKSSKRLNSKNWEETKRSKIGDLFLEGMGCDPVGSMEIGVKVPKMGIMSTNSQKSFNL